MKILLILIVVALALAPLSNFIPSKRQRQVARLREYAAVHGLFVEFRNLPGSELSRLGEKQRPEQLIYYGKRLPPSRRNLRPQQAWLAGEGGEWRGVGHRTAPPACIGLLPPAILALSQEESSCGIYWREAGNEDHVQQIVDALAAWREALAGDR